MSTFRIYLLSSLLLAGACAGEKKGGESTSPKNTVSETKTGGSDTSSEKGKLAMIAIPNAKSFQGNLTGGQPTAEQYKEVAAAGYKLVVDLRPASEGDAGQNESLAKEAGLAYTRIAIGGSGDLNEANAKALADALSEGPALVHCKSGNRVGALFALKAKQVDGKSAQEALAEGKEAGLTSMESTVIELLK